MNLIRLLFPYKCPLCHKAMDIYGTPGFCQTCYGKLPRVEEPCCKHCGKPISAVEQEYCYDCSGKKSSLNAGVALWVYDEALKKMMRDYKYDGHQWEGRLYGAELAKRYGVRFRQWKIDVIVPVPLHKKKKWFRGYNQAEEIAGSLASRCGLDMIPNMLLRKRYTTPQSGLNDKQRQANIKGAFSFNHIYGEDDILGKNILLVDDIYTTGSTLDECAEILRMAGARNVYFACLCIGRDY